MTNGYTQFVKDKKTKDVLYETYFREKILLSEIHQLGSLIPTQHGDFYPKGHSIREDVYERWRPGMDIHHVYGNRTPQRNCFLVNKCTWVQRISIFTSNIVDEEIERRLENKERVVMVDGHVLPPAKVDLLAINDGFESTAQLFTWFHADFTGRIIHWTKLRY